jgi:hypothetical protein
MYTQNILADRNFSDYNPVFFRRFVANVQNRTAPLFEIDSRGQIGRSRCFPTIRVIPYREYANAERARIAKIRARPEIRIRENVRSPTIRFVFDGTPRLTPVR